MQTKKYKFILIFLIFGWLALSLNFAFAKIEKDSDKDGLSDYEEQVVYKTDKQKLDTDGDGYRDGEEVKQLQLKLKELGYFTHPEITGYFGMVTRNAVVKMQKANGLVPYPGFVGPQTRAKLNNL